MAAAQGALQLILERITARIAVSELARKVQVEHLGGGAVEIPNGVAVVRYARAEPLPGWPGPCRPGAGGAIGFLGRVSEPRKGFPVLREAFVTLAQRRPGLRLLVAGPGDETDALAAVPAGLRERVVFLGRVSEPDKPRMLRSLHLYVAPNLGGESFGMILTEAMAAGAPVVATDLEAFRRVLDGAGELFPAGDAAALAALLGQLLDDPERRAGLAERAATVVAGYDWPVLAQRVVEVYESAIEASGQPVTGADLGEPPPVL
jgi:phosphatidylinositol alpha-mannosyltransferase